MVGDFMGYMSSWFGTKKEITEVVDVVIRHIKNEYECFSNMSDKNLRKLFLEALTSNIVVDEICNQMQYLKKEYEDN